MKHQEAKQLIIETLKPLQMIPSQEQLAQLLLYYEMLIEWNQRINLTAITEFDQVLDKHFYDSLSIVKTGLLPCTRLLDIGTGAGFPGIPIKIMFPEVEVTLLDALQKRVDFLNLVIEHLHLKGIEAFHGRAEDFAHDAGWRENFDLVASRAVANLPTLCEYAIPYVSPDGCFVAYKGAQAEEEITGAENAIKILGGKLEDTVNFSLNGGDQRSLLIIRKWDRTPEKYPRKANKIQKKPL